MSEAPDLRTVARLLAQRMDLGERSLLLEGLTRREAATLVRAALSGGGLRGEGGATAPSRARAAPGSPSAAMVPPLSGVAPTRAAPGSPEGSPPSPSPGSAAASPQSRAAAAPPEGLPVLPGDWEGVRSIALECTRCRLAETRTRVVFSDGVLDPQVLVVGEAPGQNEDETGLPFVGAAGRLLDLLLASVSVSRTENACIANVLKCRPPKNRNPLPDEIEACAPFLRKQVALLAPRVILAVGTFAGQWLTGQSIPLGKLRGTVYSYEGTPVVVTYHPAALLRNPGWTRGTWDDLQLLRQVMDGT